MSWLLIAPLLSMVAAWACTGLMLGYAARHLIDLPTERSSHVRPTPRGGGVSFVIAHLTGLVVGCWYGVLSREFVTAVGAGGLLIAAVGFIDDHRHVPAGVRLITHASGCAAFVAIVGGLSSLLFGTHLIHLGLVGQLMMLLVMVWHVNLFNFMDGIDGIAGMQALALAIPGAVLVGWQTGELATAVPFLLLAGSVAGFLYWNWPPAKIFMGDVGSGYLGFALAAMGFWTVVEGWLTVWVWVILGGAFLVDATMTLLVRANSGLALTEPHRSHAYQRLSRHWRGHRPVTLAYAAVNIGWLWPWAALAAFRPDFGAAAAALAIVPLTFVSFRLGAGRAGDI